MIRNTICSPVATIRHKPIGYLSPKWLNGFGGTCARKVLDVLDNMSLDALVDMCLKRSMNSSASGNICVRNQLINLRSSVLMPAVVFEAMMAYNQNTDDLNYPTTKDILESFIAPTRGEFETTRNQVHMWYHEVFLRNVGETSLAVRIAANSNSGSIPVVVPPLGALQRIIQLHRDRLLAKLSLPHPSQSRKGPSITASVDEIPGSGNKRSRTNISESQGGTRNTLSSRLGIEIDRIAESGIPEPMTRNRFCNEHATAECGTPNFKSGPDGLLSHPINDSRNDRSQKSSANDETSPEYKRMRFSGVQESPENNLDDSTEELWDDDLIELLASLKDEDA